MNKKLFASLGILLLFSAVSSAAIDNVIREPADGVNLIYDPTTGNLALATLGTPDRTIATIEVTSEAGWFEGAKPDSHTGLFDVYKEGKSFVLDPAGFRDIGHFGNLGAGRTADAVAGDLSVSGAAVLGGNLRDVFGGVNLVAIPEPSSMVMFVVAALGLLRFRRK